MICSRLKQLSRFSVISLVGLGLCFPITVFAAPGERGRLPDGRAYRVDSEGNEIVDYIAELELSVDSLNRRVLTLENELSQTRRSCKARGGESAAPAVVEKDLLARTTAQFETVTPAEQTPPQVMAPKCDFTNDEGRIELVTKIQRLEGEKRQLLTRLNTFESTQEASAKDSEETRLRIERLRRQLSDQSEQFSNLEKQNNALSQQNTALETAQVGAAQTAAATLEEREKTIAALRKELENVKVQLASSIERSSERASLGVSPFVKSSSSSSRAKVAVPGISAGQLKKRVAALEVQMKKRDAAFNRYNSQPGRALKLSAKNVTSSIRLLERRIPQANSSQLRAYSKEIARIEKTLRSDLATVARMSK